MHFFLVLRNFKGMEVGANFLFFFWKNPRESWQRENHQKMINDFFPPQTCILKKQIDLIKLKLKETER